MTVIFRVVNFSIKKLTRLACRIDAQELSRVPLEGPLILVANHVNFLEVPILFTQLQPRSMAGFAKAETWDHPILGPLFDLWGAIPIRRGEADLQALKRGLQVLDEGGILAVAPEGTRSGDGRLLRGHAGVVLIALQSGATLLPVAYHGGEHIWQNLRRLKRTDFTIRVGHPFQLDPGETKVTREIRQQMVDEIMWQIAAILPGSYRGYYANLSEATEAFLNFPPGSQSNLLRAESID
jgi:1-acyl-sn-glycerol-3-phosphate acyltransferase